MGRKFSIFLGDDGWRIPYYRERCFGALRSLVIGIPCYREFAVVYFRTLILQPNRLIKSYLVRCTHAMPMSTVSKSLIACKNLAKGSHNSWKSRSSLSLRLFSGPLAQPTSCAPSLRTNSVSFNLRAVILRILPGVVKKNLKVSLLSVKNMNLCPFSVGTSVGD